MNGRADFVVVADAVVVAATNTGAGVLTDGLPVGVGGVGVDGGGVGDVGVEEVVGATGVGGVTVVVGAAGGVVDVGGVTTLHVCGLYC